jgi:hypothetical protein
MKTIKATLKDNVDCWLITIAIYLLIRAILINDWDLIAASVGGNILYFTTVYRKTWWQLQANEHISDIDIRAKLKLSYSPSFKKSKEFWIFYGIVVLILVYSLIDSFSI